MKLVIQQYLSTLKESKELDVILPDLLLTMNIQPIIKPQIGVRQQGVDLAAVGIDPEDGIKKLFLFVIKCGDIGRNEWDTGKQAVRPTLNEINDTFITKSVPPQFQNLPICIVLTTGGDLLQEAKENWEGYITANKRENISYNFWGSSTLSTYFYDFLFNETLLLPEFRSTFRKTLVRLSEASYDLKDFYELFEKLLEKINNSTKRANLRNLRTCKLILKIAIEWAKESDNYKHCINMAEYCLLRYWNVIKDFNITKRNVFTDEFIEFYNTLYNLLVENNNKFADLYGKENGLHGYTKSKSPEIESIKVFEQLGYLAELGLLSLYEFGRYKDEKYFQSVVSISNNLKNVITNHKCLLNPLYDNQIIEIILAFQVLISIGEKEFISQWLIESMNHIVFAYNSLGKYFPTCTNDFYDLIYECHENKPDFFSSSTLLFYYLELAWIIRDEKLYDFIYKKIIEVFSTTSIQYWYPDKDSEQFIYKTNAGYTSGISFVCNEIPNNISKFEKLISIKKDKEIGIKDFSCVMNGFGDLLFISNRFFRTPIIPDSILSLSNAIRKNTEENDPKS